MSSSPPRAARPSTLAGIATWSPILESMFRSPASSCRPPRGPRLRCRPKLTGGRARCRVRPSRGSELLDPGPELDLRGPGAARLAQHMKIGLGDGVGVEHRVGLVGGLGAPRAADAAVDDEMRDVNALGRE